MCGGNNQFINTAGLPHIDWKNVQFPLIPAISINATTAVPWPVTISDGPDHKASTEKDDDEFTTIVKKGSVIYIFGKGDITAIRIYKGNASDPDVFSSLKSIDANSKPHDDNGKPQNNIWVGTISPTAKPIQMENYLIDYYVAGHNNPDKSPIKFTQDPRIQIKPEDK